MQLRLKSSAWCGAEARLLASVLPVAFGRYGFDVVLFGVSLRPQPAYVEEEDEEYSDSNYEGEDQEHFETDDSEDDVPAGYGYGGGGGGFGGAGLPQPLVARRAPGKSPTARVARRVRCNAFGSAADSIFLIQKLKKT